MLILHKNLNRKMADLSQEEWTKQLEADNNSIVLDVRTPEEVAQGVIPNAIHIDIFKGQGFIDEVEKLDKTKNYYVYCRSGGRSGQACSVMNQLGFENAYNLMGGFDAWQGEVAEL
ncbi:rhodanese [Winogradskyella epiphytica]|nr:rhodanese [Winogradskyella epiphytica]